MSWHSYCFEATCFFPQGDLSVVVRGSDQNDEDRSWEVEHPYGTISELLAEKKLDVVEAGWQWQEGWTDTPPVPSEAEIFAKLIEQGNEPCWEWDT